MSTNRALKRISLRFGNIETSAKKFDPDTTLEEVETNIQLLEDEWKDYRELEKVIGESESYEDLQNAIEGAYFKLKHILVYAKKEREAETSARSHNVSIDELMVNQQSFLHEFATMSKNNSDVRLPKINIPSFSGQYSEFPSFKDLFEASIDSNAKISKVLKFQYLKGLLTGEAAALVRHIAVTEANYSEAWEKIKQRYDKKRLVVANLIKQFVDQPAISKVSAKALHQIADVSDEVLRGLKVLGAEAEKRDPWLIHILVSKLDSVTKQAWANEIVEDDFPTIERFFRFLSKRSDSLDAIEVNKVSQPATSNRVKSFQSSAEPLCLKCSQGHYLSKCGQFLSLSVNDRRGFVSERKLCFNCLSPSHQSVVCRSRYRCGKCHRKHHITLHTEDAVKPTANTATSSDIEETTTHVVSNAATIPSFQSLLPTAMVQVMSQSGKLQMCRVLLDSGSQASFITEACMQRLKLPRSKANIVITGLASGKVTTRGSACVTLKSLYSTKDEVQIDALVIGQLPNRLPSVDFKLYDCSFLNDLKLADPQYNQAAPIDILIGSDRFFHILRDGRRTNSNNTVVAQRTLFGWVIAGNTSETTVESDGVNQANSCTLNLNLSVDIDSTLKRFFEQEEIPQVHVLNPEEAECEEHYKSTYRRNGDGRYVVQIPFKKFAAQLGNSENAAKRRFLSLERKLQASSLLKGEYCKFINDFINLGYMQPITEAEHQIEQSKLCYLPHHCVLKESSETTKLRVVFDGSAKTTSGVSLNETMLVGPTIQPSLWSILMRFRNHKIALTGDIEKMYNQVLVAEKDAQFQRILWRSEPSDELKHYRLNTVTFGLASSAFLAIRTMHQIAYDNQQDHPNIVEYILNDFYVDDFVSGADTVEEVRTLKDEIAAVLHNGGLKLRKWKSNSASIMTTKGTEQISMFQNPHETRILGLQWITVDDVFTFKLNLESNSKPTKRQIISEYSRVFDPLGWLSPSIVLMKIIFQNLWLLKLGWDDELPDHVSKLYQKIRSELELIESIRIKRYVSKGDKMELHGFSDASEKAYGAVVYCRAVNTDGTVKVTLMASKTKVAPIKQISLPRLELCGAHLLTKLLSLVKDTMKQPVECYAWTDSTIVLMWLSSHPARWKTFVANRTSQILDELPRKFWNHVRSEQNPADHASRGVFPSKLVSLRQWWQGPEWLQTPELIIDIKIDENINSDYLKEQRSKENLLVFNAEKQEDIIDVFLQRCSSYNKLVRSLAYGQRFLRNTRLPKAERILDYLTVEELRAARSTIIRHVQRGSFVREIDCLQKGREIRKNSDILSLAPFIDDNGILRVGGRLKHLDCQYDYKHPVILPKQHTFSKMIIRHIHVQNLHPGPSLTFHLIRQQFWVIGGRSTIRKIIKKCVVCFKNNARTSKQLMGDLPIARLKAARPFTSCGVDYAGPMQLASKKGRGARFTKGYIAVFICMVTKAIHLEVVSDLSTDAFIAALKRFVSRRGSPAHMYSDNGSNFIGAARKINEVDTIICNNKHNSSIAEHLSKSQIQWHFNPPVSPHFGGLWEAAVKSVKTHLSKCSANTHLTFEEMATLLSQIEAILNSRPLYAAADDDESFHVLTPAHFLIGSANFYVPEEEINENIHVGRLSRWQFIQQRVQSFWKKFSAEYFHNLQQRVKWRKAESSLEIGDVVLIKEDNLPSYKWALGQVTQLHPDDRGLVRVVTLKTATTILKRPIVKLCKLPDLDDD